METDRNTNGKIAKTRTSITINPDLLSKVRSYATQAATGRKGSVSSVIERALEEYLNA
jgi:hypothetical protein